MSKYPLREPQMTDATYIDNAAAWARSLTQVESRGPGDMENAWHRLETRYGIPFQAFWSLRYRPPKNVVVSIYFRLQAAYEAERERQIRRYEHEISVARQIAGPDHPAVRSAETMVENSRGASPVQANISDEK